MKGVDISVFVQTTPTGLRAKQTLVELQSVADVFEDVFSRDNTNSIEGYFGIIKRRLKKKTSTLLDLFNAVDFTEASALARSDPARPRVPPDLARCILRVLSPSAFVTLSKRGVDEFLSLLVHVSLSAFSSDSVPAPNTVWRCGMLFTADSPSARIAGCPRPGQSQMKLHVQPTKSNG